MINPKQTEAMVPAPEYLNSMENLENLIDESIRKNHGIFPWETATIGYDLELHVRNMIANKYNDAGWEFVYHRTFVKRGEKIGLTHFMFAMKKLDENIAKGYHLV